MTTYLLQIGIVLLIFFANEAFGSFDFTNIECRVLDKDFVRFPTCILKSVNRTYKYLTIKTELLQVPVTQVTVDVTVLKRDKFFKPFLYNVSFDGCKFMNQKHKDPIKSFFHLLLSKYSNMNHSCPYNHDVLVDKLDIEFLAKQALSRFPFPPSDYCFHSFWILQGKPRAVVDVFGRFKY